MGQGRYGEARLLPFMPKTGRRTLTGVESSGVEVPMAGVDSERDMAVGERRDWPVAGEAHLVFTMGMGDKREG